MIGAATRRLVRQRAENRCEYCRTHQDDEPFVTYQIEHVIALQHGGSNEDGNLALACSHCNLHKGPNLAGIDPVGKKIEPLYHPRTQPWNDHFEFVGRDVAGKTPCGRATVHVLGMNAQSRVNLRQEVRDAHSE